MIRIKKAIVCMLFLCFLLSGCGTFSKEGAYEYVVSILGEESEAKPYSKDKVVKYKHNDATKYDVAVTMEGKNYYFGDVTLKDDQWE